MAQNAERETISTYRHAVARPSTAGCAMPERKGCVGHATQPGGFALSAHLGLCAAALLIEAIAGYPAPVFRAIGHPVTWMGHLLSVLDHRLNREDEPFRRRRSAGLLALLILMGACFAAAWAASKILFFVFPHWLAVAAIALLASSTIAQRSLDTHVRAVAEALETEGLPAARQTVSQIVGRDTTALDEAGIARAAIESLAENFADGVVAPAFWLALLGLPGAIVYKAINTADSMIGHRTPRYEAFGFSAAKLDDAVNWVPARLAALLIVAASAVDRNGSPREAWRIMMRDASGHPSPNAGWPEAAMAGALAIQLGGPRAYNGRIVRDAPIGDPGKYADAAAIRSALGLYRLACALQFAAVVILWMLFARWS